MHKIFFVEKKESFIYNETQSGNSMGTNICPSGDSGGKRELYKNTGISVSFFFHANVVGGIVVKQNSIIKAGSIVVV